MSRVTLAGDGFSARRPRQSIEIAIDQSALQQESGLSLSRRKIVRTRRQIGIERVYSLRDFAKRSIGAAKRRQQVRIVGGLSQSAFEKRDRLSVPTFAREHGGMFLAPRRQHNCSDKERDDHHQNELTRCYHANDPSVRRRTVQKFTSFAHRLTRSRPLATTPNSSDVSVGLIKRGMLSDEFDGSSQAIVERYRRRPAHDVPGARIVRDKLHDLAQRRAQPLVLLDDRLVDAHELKNSLREPAD